MPFSKLVTTTKRNHIYFGPTESRKISTTLEEIQVDLNTIYNQFNLQDEDISDTALTYVDIEGELRKIGSQLSEIENTLQMLMYIRAEQDPIY